MIVKTVIITKPHYPTPAVVHEIRPAIQQMQQPWPNTLPRNKYIANQEDYNEYMNKLTVNEGDFVTLNHARGLFSLHNVHYVVELQTDFNKINWHTPGYPKPLLLVQCETPIGSDLDPWARWDTPSGLRKLTTEEYDMLVKPVHDKLQSNCIKFADAFQQLPQNR